METIKIRCQDPRCSSPLWNRPVTIGRLPKFCPVCVTRQGEEAAAWASQPLQLVCQDAECVSPSFSRLRGKGRKPNFCPVCMEKRKAVVVHRGPNKRKKTKETVDQVVFSSTSPEEIERAMFALRHQYAREEFFINDDGDDKYIMMRQRTDLSVAPIVLERIRVLAEASLESAIIQAMSEY